MISKPEDEEFEAFVRTIRRWLRHQAYEMCGDWHEADDLVQMALCRMYDNWSRLDRRAELGAYARRVVFRSFLTERRRSHRRHEVSALDDADAVPVAGRHGDVDARMALLPALRRLGTRQRAVLTLRYVLDLSVEQTARELGCATGTVTSQTVRALKSLRRELDF